MIEKLKRFYRLKLYTAKQVEDFVRKGVITPEQYADITGEAYIGK